MTDIQVLTVVIVVFGLLFLALAWNYTKKKKIVYERLDTLEAKVIPKPTFSEQILIAYWNEIKGINVSGTKTTVFVGYLKNKLSVIKGLAELLVANFDRTNKRDFNSVFEMYRGLLNEKLNEAKISENLRATLEPISAEQIEGVKFKLFEIAELDFDPETKRSEVAKAILEFVSDNFRASVMHYNLTLKIQGVGSINTSNFDKAIAENNIHLAASELLATGKNKEEVLLIQARITSFGLDCVRGIVTPEDKRKTESQIIDSLINLRGIIERQN